MFNAARDSSLLEWARPRPMIYLITDRTILRSAGDDTELDALIRFIERAVKAGVDLIQIRERDLSARQLFHLASEAEKIARSEGAMTLVNDRADIAASVGAGVHLTTRSMRAEIVRKAFGTKMLIGASTHNLEEAEAAEGGGADFVVFGPVFETESKKVYGPPAGLESLKAVASLLSIPVLALGGIKTTNFKQALDAGAAGIAAISLFAQATNLSGIVEEIKSYGKQ
jgi:thiamine-phosphate pyrophosphorylase